MAAAESEIAAKLIERLLADPVFRDRFRRNPAAACREAGLESLAEEMRIGAGKAMHTLDIRESRSSLAGVMMAAAMEGIGVYEFSKHVVPHLDDLPDAVGDVISRVNLPALPGAGSLSGGAKASAAPVPAAPGEEEVVAAGNGGVQAPLPPDAVQEPAAPGGAKGAAAAPEEVAAKPAGKAGGGGKDAPSPVAPELAALGEGGGAAAGATREAAQEPLGSELPSGAVKPQASVGGPEPGAVRDPSAGTATPAPAPAATPEPQGSTEPVDPSQLGQEGTGGKPNAEALALLENKNIVLDDVGVADIKAGKIDPRIVGVLTKLSDEHKIVVSCMCSDHSKFTSGGSVSNHAYGRGLDIASIDGEIVSPGSALAREMASQLSQLDPAIRPDEIGSPFSINGPGYFSDAAHMNHIHVGFKQELTPDFKLPAELSAGAPVAVVPGAMAVVPASPAAGAAPVAPAAAAPKRESGLFAVPEPAKLASAEAAKSRDSGLFLRAVEQPRAVAAAPAVPADAAGGPAVDSSAIDGNYPGDDAPREEIAAWMAKQAQARGLPPQLPVMAALVESGLKNLNFGDADSVGYFQMRESVWNQGEYAGYAGDPAKQLDWFLDTAEGVKEQRESRNQSITDPNQFGEWIADVERPAEQYRGRYQLQLDEANKLVANNTPATPTPAPAAPAEVPTAPAAAGGGSVEGATKALLSNTNVELPPGARSDLEQGVVDPRLVAVLAELAKDHEIGLSVIKTGHDQFTSGGSVSNHFVGRGLDIARVDGEPVSPGNGAARELVSAIAGLQGAIRPTEVGSPWDLEPPEFFTDGAHQDHVHVAFDGELPAGFEMPGSPAPVVPAAVAASPAAGAAPVAPAQPKRESGLFALPEPAKLASAEAAEPRDSGLFLRAVEQPRAVAAAPATPGVPADAAGAPAVDLSAVDGEYPGDDAAKEQIAAWMAKHAQARGLPPQLPVMAALVESGLQNLNHGDADSVGYFQMRMSIWNQGATYGYAEDPKKQLDWFLDTAERVQEQRESRNQSITDPDQFGEWIADVERPAEQYRGRYQLQLDEADKLLAKNTPATTLEQADPVLDAAPPAMARGAGPKALAALEEAQKYTGTPYKWGGSTPETGFDCSGLVQWAYARAGIQIPRVTYTQIAAENGTAVRRSELLPGDLVFFRDASGDVHHVGMSMGGDKFLHAPHTGDVVKVSSLDEPYYNEQFTGGRRFDDATGAPAAAAAPEAAPAIDPAAVAAAQAAVARDAAEVSRPNSGLFKAIGAQEARKNLAAGGEPAGMDSGLFLRAVTPEQAAQAKAASAPAAPVPAAPAAVDPAPVPAAPEVAADPPVANSPPPDLQAVPADYPGDDAGQQALAKWLAKRAEKAGLPPELPVMAALVESGVRNLDYGDADSVGFFQMRKSIWDRGATAGFATNPGIQAKWFVDTALAVKRQRVAAGDADFGSDPRKWGEWIADVERPAAQYRGRYQPMLEKARGLLR